MRVRRRVRTFPFFLLLMVLTSFFHAGHCVWSFNMPYQVYLFGMINPKDSICGPDQGWSTTQQKICYAQEHKVTIVAEGFKMGIAECRHQFQYRRWNCSIPVKDRHKMLTRITNQDTREAAFTYAITSAGLVWALARACAEGNFSSDSSSNSGRSDVGACHCSREGRPKNLKQEYTWGGCSDNIGAGMNFSIKFLDAEEKDTLYKVDKYIDQQEMERVLMNMHNNQVGREIVMKMSVIECKCHGVSGSCNLKTCWRQLSEFREIGNKLHDKYDAAVNVYSRRDEGLLKLFRKKITRSYMKRQVQEKPQEGELVYLKPSPNFCFKDTKLGIHGTRGRKCIKDSPGTDGCSVLCCDRGYTSRWVTVEKRCKCKFYWCCTVRCKTCASRVLMHTCK